MTMWNQCKLILFASLLAALAYASASTNTTESENVCSNEGESFSPCVPAPICRPTCTNPDNPLLCRAPCAPGCACSDGQVLDTEKAQCVSEKDCTDVCSLEPEVGLCKGYIPRLFYNSTSSQCEEFIYGGCGGNGNNFETHTECQQQCQECSVEGQVFSTCARPCTFTCDNVNQLQCATVCTTGCDCPGGQVIDTELNKCVPVEECPNVNGSCLAGNGTVISDGETTGDECSSCTCVSGRLSCFVIDCAFPDCDNYYTPEGACCPICPPIEVEVCVYNGELHSPGDTFVAEDECNKCSCLKKGRVSCTNTKRCRKLSKLSCPQEPFGVGVCTTKCVYDSDCKRKQKCCNTACGGAKCVKAVRRKSPQTPDCAAVLCQRVDCPNAAIPKGECCAVCPKEEEPTLPPECAAVLCLAVDCPDATVPEGECCAVCPKPILPPKCAAVTCLAVDCLGAVIPKGECCAVCPNVCEYNGLVHQPGESFPSTDGCNTCFCSESGDVACTEIACLPKLVCPEPTGFGICVDLCFPGFACGPGQKCCSNGCGHVCTNATNCALVDCAPTPCVFPGGVVIPAGEDECCPTCGCMSGGTTYRMGESFPAGDGCNTCSCSLRGPLCTLIACGEPKQ